jgi:hypothetical protein
MFMQGASRHSVNVQMCMLDVIRHSVSAQGCPPTLLPQAATRILAILSQTNRQRECSSHLVADPTSPLDDAQQLN